MWKRFLVIIIALVGTFSVVYTFHQELFAETSPYAIGGEITGRVNQAPSNLTVADGATNIGIQQYDVIQMNTYNSYANKPFAWKLIRQATYTNYSGNGCTPSIDTVCNNPAITAWFALSNDPIDYLNPGGELSDFVPIPNATWASTMSYSATDLFTSMTQFNAKLSSNTIDKSFLTYRDFTSTKEQVEKNNTNGSFHFNTMVKEGVFSVGAEAETLNNVFTPSRHDYSYPFGSIYWGSMSYHNAGVNIYNNHAFSDAGLLSNENNSQLTSSNIQHDLRAAAYLSKSSIDNIVFAVSDGPTKDGGNIFEVKESGNAAMKPRVYDASMTIEFLDITRDTLGNGLAENNQVSLNSTIFFKVNANKLNNDCLVSALIFDENGQFIYYKILGSGSYQLFDTTGLDIGKYQVALVNEEFNTSVSGALKSSKLTEVRNFEVVPALSNLNVKLTPQNHDVFQYGVNVSQGQQVASITSVGGAGVSYELSASTRENHTLDYKKFEIKDGSITVKETGGLSSGEYRFIVKAKDIYNNVLEKEVTIQVEQASPKLKFSTSENRYVSYASTKSFVETITHQNTDGKENINITYEISNPLLASVEKDIDGNAVITLNDTLTYGTFILTAKIDATTNYSTMTISKTITIYEGIQTAKFTAAHSPIYTTHTQTAGETIGKISFTGGVGDYTFKLEHNPEEDALDNANADKFALASETSAQREIALTITAPLSAGTYKVSVKIEDVYHDYVYLPIVITVYSSEQSNFDFYNPINDEKMTNKTLQFPYGTKSAKVLAKGGEGNGTISYRLKEGSPKNILDIDPLDGTITNIRSVGTVVIEAVKASDDIYKASTIEMSIEITAGEQELSFKKDITKQLYKKDATFDSSATLTENTNESKRLVTYESTTLDVCTVDANGIVTMKQTGTCTIKAFNKDENYKEVSITRNIEIYDALDGSFIQKNTPQADTTSGSVNSYIGDVSATNGYGKITYSITNATSVFKVDSTTGEISMRNDLHANHLQNAWDSDKKAYLLKETVTIQDEDQNTKEIEIEVACTGAKLTLSFQDVQNNTITKEYGANTYYTFSIKNNTGNGAITYSLEANPSIELSDLNTSTGRVKLAHISDKAQPAIIKAEVAASNGYDSASISVNVVVTAGTQSIDFDANTITKQEFQENGTFTIQAVLTRTDTSQGVITYDASPSSVCEIVNSNQVRMRGVGTCTMQATNADENYEKAEISKDITIYQSATGSFTQINTLQAEVNAKGDMVLGSFSGVGGQGTLTYALSDAISKDNEAAQLVSIDSSDGTISLSKDITASDIASFAYVDGFYQLHFQVVVSDDGKERATIHCIANMQGAPNKDVKFKDETGGIITKTFGDSFVLTLLNNAGGTPSYEIDANAALPKDVITKITGSVVKIEHANDPNNASLPIIHASIPAANGYEAKNISVKVSVGKAKQESFQFHDEQMNMKTETRITPVFDNALSSTGITLESSDESIIEILDGDLKTTTKTGIVTIKATANGDRDYEEKTITKDIIVYDELGGSFKQVIPYAQANTDTAKQGTIIGSIVCEGGQGTVEREIMEGNEYFILPSPTSNMIKLNKDITADDLIGTWDAKKNAYVLKTKIKLTDDAKSTFIFAVDVYIQGAPLEDASFIDEQGNPIDRIEKPYVQNGDFMLEIGGNTGNGTITYRMKDDASMPDDVLLGVENDGTVYIANANDASINANDVVVQADIQANNGYEAKIVECIVTITKAEQDFAFVPKDGAVELKVSETYTPKFSSKPKGGNVILELKNPAEDEDKVSLTNTSLTALKAGDVILQATAVGGRNYKDVICEKSITIYDEMKASFTQDVIPQAETDSALASTPIGSISNTGGIGDIANRIDESVLDGAYFDVINKQTIVLRQDIDANAIRDRWDDDKKAYVMNILLHQEDSKGNTADTPISIRVKGAPLQDVAFKDKNGSGVFKITKPYSKTPFSLELVQNKGDGKTTYQLKQNVKDMPLDVIKSVSSSGIVVIENANEKTNPNKVWVEAIIDAKNGYDEKTIECEIYIEQAPQTGLTFKETEISLYHNGSADTILENVRSSGEVLYSSNDMDIVTVDTSGTIQAGTTSGDAIVTAIVQEDRNYAQAITTMIVHVQQADVYPLVIQVPTLTYGDAPVQAQIKQQGATGVNLTQHWTSSDETIATIDANGFITPLHAGKTTITLQQTSDGEPDVSTSAVLTIKPKPISLTIANVEIYAGEDIPTFTFDEILGLLDSDKDSFILPSLTCLDENDDAITSQSPAGTYSIKGTYQADDNPDYTITAISDGTLTILQDKSTSAWYRLESEAEITPRGWYNKPVSVHVEAAANAYDTISDSVKGPWDSYFEVVQEGIHTKDIYFKNSTSNAIATKQEKEIKIDYHTPKITSIAGIKTNTSTFARFMNTLTLDTFYKVGTEIKILAEDVIPEKGMQVSGIDTISYKVYRVVNNQRENDPILAQASTENPAIVTLDEVGIYEVCAIASDNAGNIGEESCQKAEIKKLDVDVDGDGKPDFNDPDETGCADFNIVYSDEEGNQKVLNVDANRDGIPERNIDSDGDGEPDINVDTDDDGLPDINLVLMTKKLWVPTMCVTQHGEQYASGVEIEPQINVDTNHDRIPEINIDIDGDMKADINITKENQTTPFLNIAIVHEPWKPETTYTYQKFTYDTKKDLERYLNIDTNHDGLPDVNIDLNDDGIADINIDTTGNEIPNVDIDSDGDGLPDVNIDSNGDGIPDAEIMEIKDWDPNYTVEKDIEYGTILIERLDYLEHQGIQVAKPNERFLPNYALKVSDVTKDRKDEISSILTQDGREIESVFEIDLLRDGVKVQPDGTLTIRIPVMDGLLNPSILLQKEDGNYQAVNATVVDGYYVIECEYLGIVSILKEQLPTENKTPSISSDENVGGAIKKDVNTNVAGSFTGDHTSASFYFIGIVISILCLKGLYKRKKA